MELQKRKVNRLKEYDYSQVGAYFITICTENRKCILSEVVGGEVLDAPHITLKFHGSIADKILSQMNDFYESVKIDKYVIMPNHIHMILIVKDNGTSRTSSPTKQHSFIPQFVSSFKRFCNKKYGCNIWQRSFYDHVIRDGNDYLKISNYIDQNPHKWHEDKYFKS